MYKTVVQNKSANIYSVSSELFVTMFRNLQESVYEWSETQFPGQPDKNPAYGIVEEFAELKEVLIAADSRKEELDAVGDTIVYAADFAARRGLDLQEAAEMDIDASVFQNLDESVFEADPLDGAVVAIGRLYRSILKREQGIRLDEQRVGDGAEQRALALLIDRLDKFASERDYTLEDCVVNAWDEEVCDREWDSSYK